MIRRISALVVGLAAVVTLYATTSTSWQVSGYSDFIKGRLSGLSVSFDGLLVPGPTVSWQAPLNQPADWALVPGPDGSFYAATGHNGKVLQVSASGEVSVVWSAPQAEVFAICIGGPGVVYAGTSPDGAVYRIEKGNAREIWRSPAKYIWSLALAPDGGLYAGTGEQGRIYRISRDGASSVYYDTQQINVTSLTVSSEGRLLAGTDPNGLLFEVTAAAKATVLYDSSLPEIRSIVVANDGTIYAAAMGGAVSTRTNTASGTSSTASTGAVVATNPTVITVTESADNTTTDTPAAAPPASQSSTSSGSTAGTPSAGTQTTSTEVSGVDKSAIYKIGTDRSVETLRTSKDENVYDLIWDNGSLLFSTDVRGRIYRQTGHRSSLLTEVADGTATRLVKSGDKLAVAMSNPGRVFLLDLNGGSGSEYESQVHDSGSVARWGHLQWHGSGSGVSFQTRTGFSARPDNTWSDWSPVQSPSSLITSAPARFIQFRAVWAAGSTAHLDTVDVPYLPQNNPPAVHSITVTSVLNQNPAKAAVAAAANNSPYSVTVTDTGEAPAASSGTSANQTATHLQSTQTQISWQADDPDGDKLAYTLYFRTEDESQWQLVRNHISENTIVLDPDVFADGRYFFRVVASDAPSNPPEYAQQSELVSTPVLIDNTPPEVIISNPVRKGDSLDVDVEAMDKLSPLRLCEFSLDAGAWQPVESTDGVTDSPHERFHLHLDRVRPGEHLLVFRVYDIVNNAGLAKVVLR